MVYNIRIYNKFQTLEIQRHKYFLSLRFNREVGFEEASLDWVNSELAKDYREIYRIKEQEIFDLVALKGLENICYCDVRIVLGEYFHICNCKK